MIDRTTKLRWRRRVRLGKRQVEELGTQAEEGLERHFFKRFSRLTRVRRFIAAWVMLFTLLIGGVLYQTRALGKYYLTDQPAPGGIFTEGILGSFTNANPIYASGSVDSSVTKLLFAGLFKFDERNKLVGDLADRWTVGERGLTYTVYLRPNLKWQDGVPLTSADVLYTYEMIQNPDAKSPLATSWQGIKVSAPKPDMVVFVLPNVLSAFPLSMTNGIVPKHRLEGFPASQLRSVGFNTKTPVGAGPFKLDGIEVVGKTAEDREQYVGLVPNPQYHAGPPKVERFIIRSFRNEKRLAEALRKNEVSAAAGLSVLPEDLKKNTEFTDYNIPLNSQVLVFFKTTGEILKDTKVRQALGFATNPPAILQGLGRPVLPSNEPLLVNQVGYDKAAAQNVNDPKKAKQLLDDAGWKLGQAGIRTKNGVKLSFSLYTQTNSTYDYVAQQLKQQWRSLGVDISIRQQSDEELQTTLAFHNYDALLYGITLGADPDVFVYWHSSQADIRSPNRLNFSEYHSGTADKALEAGRTRDDPTIRAVKYRPFLDAWRDDVPAIALYQPRYLYVVHGKIANFQPVALNAAADRYNNVANWLIRSVPQPIR